MAVGVPEDLPRAVLEQGPEENGVLLVFGEGEDAGARFRRNARWCRRRLPWSRRPSGGQTERQVWGAAAFPPYARPRRWPRRPCLLAVAAQKALRLMPGRLARPPGSLICTSNTMVCDAERPCAVWRATLSGGSSVSMAVTLRKHRVAAALLFPYRGGKRAGDWLAGPVDAQVGRSETSW